MVLYRSVASSSVSLCFWLLLLQSFCGGVIAHPTTTLSSKEHADAVVEWVRSKGGYFNEKLEIAPLWEGPKAPLGVFATERIDANETLLEIPKTCYFSIEKRPQDDTVDETKIMNDLMTAWHNDYCALAQRVQKEISLGDASKFAPYMNYLKIQPRGQTPATWSKAGKQVLQKLLPPESDAVNWMDQYHKNSSSGCLYDGEKDKKRKNQQQQQMEEEEKQQQPWLAKAMQNLVVPLREMVSSGGSSGSQNTIPTAALHDSDNNNNKVDSDKKKKLEDLEHWIAISIQRGYDNILVPIWDMVNHDNGKINTETNSLHDEDEEFFEVWASMEIKKGDEIYHSYDMCLDCSDISSYWGTIEILRDFGFVEDYPQRWVFWQKKVYFEIWDDEPDRHLELYWDDEEEDSYGLPDQEGMQYMKDYLQQFLDVEDTIQSEINDLPEVEKYMINKFHKSGLIALKMAIDIATKEYLKNQLADEDEL